MTVWTGYCVCICFQRGWKSASARRIQREQWAIKAIRVNFISAGTCWGDRSCYKSVMREAGGKEKSRKTVPSREFIESNTRIQSGNRNRNKRSRLRDFYRIARISFVQV